MNRDFDAPPGRTSRRIELIAGSGCYVNLTCKPKRKRSLLPRRRR